MADYYADSNVPGPGSGTIGDPWDDATTHLPGLVAGDTLYLRAGSYAEAEIKFGNNGTAVNPITLKAYNNEAAIITGVVGDHGIDTSGYDYCVIEDLEIDKSDQSNYGIKIEGDNCTVRNCEIHNCKYGGVTIHGSDNTVEDCVIYDHHNTDVTDAIGVMIDNGYDNIITGCTIYDCDGDCVQMRNTGGKGGTQILDCELYVSGPARALCVENAIDFKQGDASYQCIIRGNTIHGFRRNNGTCGGSGDPGPSVTFHTDAKNILVENNTFYDCSHGITVEGVEDVIIRQNVFYDFVVDWNGDSKAIVVSFGASDPEIYNNTFVSMPDKMYDLDNLCSPTITNNLHQDTGDCDGGALASYDYNGWYDTSDSFVGAHDTTGTAPQPNFVDAGSDDYRLSAASSAIDAGTNVGLPYTGSAPDLGAYEYTAPGTTVIMVVVVVVVMTP